MAGCAGVGVTEIRIVDTWSESISAAVVHRPDWHDQAACKGHRGDLFFGDGFAKQAKRICFGCDVKRQCLEYALTSGEEFGVWGGKTAAERRMITGHPVSMRFRARRRGQS
jgi:WhiB family redox-sensing transcriptional regulator